MNSKIKKKIIMENIKMKCWYIQFMFMSTCWFNYLNLLEYFHLFIPVLDLMIFEIIILK